MGADPFIDTNIVIYAIDDNSTKRQIARELIHEPHSMSTQVIMESVNILIKKLGFSHHDAFEHARFLLFNSAVTIISPATLLKAFEIAERYQYSHWDSLIIAAALELRCSLLYSEDLKDGQVIEGSLTIRNPFISAS
jgi:predicted nucleic acid-binding protein